jgi:Carboxypeptidase regulatory-like domain
LPRCPSRTIGGIAALLCGATAALPAQSLTGSVVEQDSRQPVVAALVQLLAAERDSILFSLVTSAGGRFSIVRLTPGRYRLRILRIGFRPWTSEPLAFEAGQGREELFAIPAVPVVLSEITVEGKSPCRGSPREDRRMALLWDEARTALGLLDAAGGEEVLEFRSILTRRMVDPGDHLVSENSLSAFGRGAWPIASLPAESLARFGFVQPRDTLTGPVYFGPDVAVFFSDAFLRTHCFRLVPPARTEPELLGLGFEPVKGRQVADIEGVLWLDRGHNLLHRLDYAYTGLWQWVPRGSAGGRLEFNQLPGGQLIVTGWRIRAPVARIESWPEGTRVRDESTLPFFGPGKVVLHGFREEVGQVQDIRLTDGRVLWRLDGVADTGGAPTVPSQGVQRP